MANKKSKSAVENAIKTNSPAAVKDNAYSGIATPDAVGKTNRSAGRNDDERSAKTKRNTQESIGWPRRIAKILGSLQLAVVLLALFAFFVFVGTAMESKYSTKIAQELVYKAWWFRSLMFLLIVNIFFAAAKKWPFKRHQTGFVVTHIGLITILTGFLLHGWFGVDAVMQMIDTNDPAIHEMARRNIGSVPQVSNTSYYADVSMIKVERRDKNNDWETEYQGDFLPGALPWQQTSVTASQRMDLYLRVLNFLAAPFGHHWSNPLKDGGRIEVLNYLPFSKREEYSPAPTGQLKEGFVALKLQLRSPNFPKPLESWLADDLRGNPNDRSFGGQMPIRVDMLGKLPSALRQQFLNPPSADKLGTMGVLTFLLKGKGYDIPVDGNLNKKMPVGNTGLEVKIVKYLSGDDENFPLPVAPGLSFQLYRNGEQQGEYLTFSRLTGVVVGQNGISLQQGVGDNPYVFYHAADFSGGQRELRGVLQFVYDDSGENLFYRAFVRRETEDKKQEMVLDGAGEVDTKSRTSYPLWGKMQWSFSVLEYLPKAIAKTRYLSVNINPGSETEEDKIKYPSAIYCRLTTGGSNKEFYIQKESARTITVGDDVYKVRYTYKEHELPFQLKLEKAESTKDPGTNAPATYASYVQLFDNEKGINGKRIQITMNEPLEYRSYMFYQSTYQDLNVYDSAGKPVSLSGFTVGRDPWLGLMYRGSVLLGLGIFLMFYMKAYFFKPKSKVAESAAITKPNGPTENTMALFFVISGSVILTGLFIAILVVRINNNQFDAGQIFDIFTVLAILNCLWVGLDWARTVCQLVGLFGGLLLMYIGWSDASTFWFVAGVVFLSFGLMLFLPFVRNFLNRQTYGSARLST